MKEFLMVRPGFNPGPAPLAGGGFRWSQNVTLLRGGVEIAAARACQVTWHSDYQLEGLEESNLRVIEKARPGDSLRCEGARFGNGSYAWDFVVKVASPMGERRKKTLHLRTPKGVQDPLLVAREVRPLEAERIRARREAARIQRLAAIKAEAALRHTRGPT